MHFTYDPVGVCPAAIEFDLENGKVYNVRFHGGCSGNAQGVSRLVEGMTVAELERRLRGIRCGGKPTSCPDQLATAVHLAQGQSE